MGDKKEDNLRVGLQRTDSEDIEKFEGRLRAPDSGQSRDSIKTSVGFEEMCGQGKIGDKKQTPSIMNNKLKKEKRRLTQMPERTCKNLTIIVTIVCTIQCLFGIFVFVSAFVPVFSDHVTTWLIVVPFGIIMPIQCIMTIMAFWMVLKRRQKFKRPLWKLSNKKVSSNI